MRILFVLANFYPYIGGAEKYTRRLAELLVKRGHSVKVITRAIENAPTHEVIDGVEVDRLPLPKFLEEYLFTWVSLPHVIRELKKFDIVYTSSNYGALSAFIAARLSRKPVVFTCNEVLGERWGKVEAGFLSSRIKQAIEALIVRLPYDQSVTLSEATHQDLLQSGVSQKNTSIVYLGIDDVFLDSKKQPTGKLRQLCGIHRDDFLYVFFGRPGVTKGVEYLLKASQEINATLDNAHLALILAREPREQYLCVVQRIEQLKYHGDYERIHLISPFIDPEPLIQHLLDADCVVIPSLTEGFGLTTAEACALEIPVIATNVGSIPEVISGKYTFVEPASPQSISEAVVKAYRGEYQYETPKKIFSWEQMASQYESLFQELLS
jgi:D-inositol-3-phosphate glycosyltransferase